MYMCVGMKVCRCVCYASLIMIIIIYYNCYISFFLGLLLLTNDK